MECAMKPSWTYTLGENIISTAKEEKNLGAVIQSNFHQKDENSPLTTSSGHRGITWSLQNTVEGAVTTNNIRQGQDHRQRPWTTRIWQTPVTTRCDEYQSLSLLDVALIFSLKILIAEYIYLFHCITMRSNSSGCQLYMRVHANHKYKNK